MRVWVMMLGVLPLAYPGAAAAERVSVSMPVALVAIHPGEVVKAELIAERNMLTSPQLARSYYQTAEEVVGKVAQRVLPAGRAIPLNALREPYAFKEGARVSIVFAMGGLDIRGVGIALKPGVAGMTTEVRNPDTGIVVRGVVHADGSVRLGAD